AYIIDPAYGYAQPPVELDVAFICVPTDMKHDGSADTSIVESILQSGSAKLYCIKSTVPIGFTEGWLGCAVFSPEYYGGTLDANGHDYDFVIIGGLLRNIEVIARLYSNASKSSLRVHLTDSTTAEF